MCQVFIECVNMLFSVSLCLSVVWRLYLHCQCTNNVKCLNGNRASYVFVVCAYLCVSMSVWESVHVSVRDSDHVCLSVCLSVCLGVWACVWSLL